MGSSASPLAVPRLNRQLNHEDYGPRPPSSRGGSDGGLLGKISSFIAEVIEVDALKIQGLKCQLGQKFGIASLTRGCDAAFFKRVDELAEENNIETLLGVS